MSHSPTQKGIPNRVRRSPSASVTKGTPVIVRGTMDRSDRKDTKKAGHAWWAINVKLQGKTAIWVLTRGRVCDILLLDVVNGHYLHTGGMVDRRT